MSFNYVGPVRETDVKIIGGPFQYHDQAFQFKIGYDKARKDAGLPKMMNLRYDHLDYRLKNNVARLGWYVFLPNKQKVKVKLEEIGSSL